MPAALGVGASCSLRGPVDVKPAAQRRAAGWTVAQTRARLGSSSGGREEEEWLGFQPLSARHLRGLPTRLPSRPLVALPTMAPSLNPRTTTKGGGRESEATERRARGAGGRMTSWPSCPPAFFHCLHFPSYPLTPLLPIITSCLCVLFILLSPSSPPTLSSCLSSSPHHRLLLLPVHHPFPPAFPRVGIAVQSADHSSFTSAFPSRPPSSPLPSPLSGQTPCWTLPADRATVRGPAQLPGETTTATGDDDRAARPRGQMQLQQTIATGKF